MLKKIILILILSFTATSVNAQVYLWRYRTHATDCTALTDGKLRDLCYEEDSQNMYKCEPSAGDCSGSEWKLVDDEDVDVTLAGTGTYLSLSGQEITVDPITESDISDLTHIVNHDDLADMPDSSGVDTNHDTRYVAKVQTGTPATPTPFAGMLWYDTDATGSAVTSTVNIVTKTGAYTLTSDDVVVLANGTFTLTLPTAVGISGKMYDIKNIGTGTVTVDGDGTETIDDGLTAVMSVRYEAITIISDGSNWNII